MAHAGAGQPVEGLLIAQKYRLEQCVAEGGMATIWRAVNVQLGAAVAIKFLKAELSRPELVQRLRLEARAAAQLAHPAIVRVFDIEETAWGDPCIVMELLEGETLADLLTRGPLPPARALGLLLPIAEALTLVHSRGVVHRDLKPENVFIARTPTGGVEPKLLDFGIAKVMRSVELRGRRLTGGGTIVGSPGYMSPEQVGGTLPLDQRSDLWSFCVVLYEALAGTPPFVGDEPEQVLRSVIEHDPLPLSTWGVDAQLADIVGRGLCKDREQRPPTLQSLAEELSAWLHPEGIREEPPTVALVGGSATGRDGRPSIDTIPFKPRRRWVPAALAAVAALALLAGVAWAAIGEQSLRVTVVPTAAPPKDIHVASELERPLPAPVLVADPPKPAAQSSVPRRPAAPTPVSAPRSPSAPTATSKALEWELNNPYGI